jgi:NAD(P)-dependent dehydrogenase (short-subunit alcohol dehydrogenase family)
MPAKTILVTGSTDGIGRQTALELLRLGHRVIVHGRSPDKTTAAAEGLRTESGSQAVDAWPAELASLAALRAAAPALLASHPKLDVLLHNAGVFMNERRLSVDGFELTFAVNHLAPFLLTHLLAPALEAAAPSRVVVVSSVAHGRGPLDFADLQLQTGFTGYAAYARSKMCNVLFASELAERWKEKRIAANSLHPGVVGTKLLKEGFGMDGNDSLAQGAATSVHLAVAPEVEGVTGKYFSSRREAALGRYARDPEVRRKLWEESARLTGL